LNSIYTTGKNDQKFDQKLQILSHNKTHNILKAKLLKEKSLETNQKFSSMDSKVGNNIKLNVSTEHYSIVSKRFVINIPLNFKLLTNGMTDID
jgi:hypothetical protein